VLAKHDETYMPREVADAIAKAKAAGVSEPKPGGQPWPRRRRARPRRTEQPL